MLYHFPIELYKERYTSQLCGKGHNGWLESKWLKYNVDFRRITPNEKEQVIKKGSVLDACGRSIWCFEQLNIFLKLIADGKITSEDVLYFADFWHPGIEALAYAFHLTGIKPKMFAFCHAQSVDQNDFTFEMLPWIRHYEKGNGAILNGIFVNCNALKNLLVKQNITDPNKIHVCGHIYNSSKVKELFPSNWKELINNKKKQVVFSSRWDKEKDPLLFLKVVKFIKKIHPEFKFIYTTSASELKSNDQSLITALQEMKNDIEIKTNQTKTEYYSTLLESQFQFNCAHQDFISYCLLEALTCECIPIYPNYLSFPEVLPSSYLYDKGDYISAGNLILDLNNKKFDLNLNTIIEEHDKTLFKMLNVMEVFNV